MLHTKSKATRPLNIQASIPYSRVKEEKGSGSCVPLYCKS